MNSKNKYSLSTKILIIIGVLCFITIVFCIMEGYSFDRIKFGLKDCIINNNCIEKVQYKIELESKLDKCGKISTDFEKDICYQNFIFDSYDVNFLFNKDANICYEMNNIYLKFVCLRTTFRPHMRQFMTNQYTNLDLFGLSERYDYFLGTSYENVYRTFLDASESGSSEESIGLEKCNSLKEIQLIGECNFYVATAVLLKQNHAFNKTISKVTKICDQISYPFWKHECYYLIADEIAFRYNSDDIPLDEISKFCSLSKSTFPTSSCFNHLTHIIPFKRAVEFCLNLNNTSDREDCFTGLGNVIMNMNFNDLNQSLMECMKFDELDKSNCINSVYKTYVKKSVEKPSELYKYCLSLDEKYLNSCLDGLIGQPEYKIKSKKVVDLMEKCEELPINLSHSCFRSVGFNIMWFSAFDVNTTIKKCNLMLGDQRKMCYEGAIKVISKNYYNNISRTFELCDELPLEFVQLCKSKSPFYAY